MGVKRAVGTIPSQPMTSRVMAPGRRFNRSREKRLKHAPTPVRLMAELAAVEEPTADLVRIAVLAMEDLGRASMRACFSGTEVQVTVPDARTAAIFEAAIAETAQKRATDRLIRIVVG